MNPLLRAVVPYAIGAALVVVAVLGVRWYGASQYQAGIDQANADHAMAELTEFKAQTGRLAGISSTLEDALVALRDAKPKTIERYTRVEVQSPLPAGCRIDADRLQHINEAGRVANTASQPGSAVPIGARGDQR
ncbi:hypothetical protein LMG26858_04442 [Achromobacter anxifer]|uniref:Uncharacterized protein n=1 Tax=Achromobacter anxifer TaxID=1287737 RepID=A0A6S7EBL1_9BURK|nr:hypothetical protein [Achromobacter anxifer]CAB3905141.1 hypothetical protein LMG26858_04442 [Achromobacter anxifer]CAB5512065.1 hypothetical protein LMG26857_01354 [Achromobacter anxifer]